MMDRSWAVQFSVVLVLASAVVVRADDPVRDHHIVADDYFGIGMVTGCVMSPDGRRVAYTELRWEPPAEKRNLDVWVVERESRAVTRLTFDPAADGNPQWSADGRWIYFSSAPKRTGEEQPPYNGKAQVWRISPQGGSPFPVTRVPDGIDDFELSADGQSLYYTVGEKQVDDAWKDLREKHDQIIYGRGVVKFSQLWKLDLQSWRAEKIIDDKRVIRDFAISPDEKRLAMLTTPTGKLITNEGWSRVDVWEPSTGRIRQVPDRLWREEAPSPYGWLETLAWSGDGTALAFRVDWDGYPSELFVADFGGQEIAVQKLTRPMEVFPTGGRMCWRGKTRDLCFVAQHRSLARVFCISNIQAGKQGNDFDLISDDVAVNDLSLSADGNQMAVVLSRTTHPPDVYVYNATPPATRPVGTRLTKVNPQVDTWLLPQIERVTWKGWNGDQVEGILELPPGYQRDRPLPMIVEIHGGPTSASRYEMRFWIYGRVLMAARGYAVLSPNYRGSTGYGDKFLTELVGHKNDRDVIDILAGVDAMIEKGIADADRLGVMGWSNGGYLTNCLITTTDRFKAASSGAGVFDAAMQWCAEDTPGHVINFQKGLPWEQPAQMQKASPLYRADRIKTPTIIHVGEKDRRCPPAHSEALFRALHHYLGVPTELIKYPGEGHSPTTYKNRKAKLDWDLAWFEKYLPVQADGDAKPSADSGPT
ncbi:MAG: S9 family peptidase [Phycisphaerae bacterium]